MRNAWPESTLEDVCIRITDGAHASPKSVESGLPMASVKDLTPNGITLETCRRISEEDFAKLVRQGCQPQTGDVLVAKDGATALDTVCQMKQTLDVVLLSSVAILRPDQGKVIPAYLRYFLDSDTTRRYLKSGFVTGAAIPRVILKDFKRAKITPPPLTTQRKIASVLSAYDDLIENNTRRIEILEEIVQAIYREWFVTFRFPGHEQVGMVDSESGPIPKGWEVKPLGDIAEQVRRNAKPEEFDPETPYVGLEHIPRKSIALSEWGTAEEVQSGKLAFQKGEILFGKIRPYFHKVAVAPIEGLCSSDTIVITPRATEYSSIVLCTVSGEEFVDHATQTSQGTKMPRADWNVLVKYPVAIPPTSLLDPFNELVQDIVAQIQNLTFRNRNLHRTRDLLLPKLISGDVDIERVPIEVGNIEVEVGA